MKRCFQVARMDDYMLGPFGGVWRLGGGRGGLGHNTDWLPRALYRKVSEAEWQGAISQYLVS